MKNVFGTLVNLSLFGESHGECIGAVLDGIPAGTAVDESYISRKLQKRAAFGNLSTDRHERDDFKIVSGTRDGKATGAPICILIPNRDFDSASYDALYGIARPSHADYTAHLKYKGFEDARGGGHLSGRLTAALCAAGAMAQYAAEQKGIKICTHILECDGISDREIESEKDCEYTENADFPVLDETSRQKIKERVLQAKENGDSLGAKLETVIFGMPKGVGEPVFDNLESVLSHAVFSVPAIKGIEFGAGFGFCSMRGSDANDSFRIDKNGNIYTQTNNCGGILGGISNGMPIRFCCAVKPTPSIASVQKTVDFINMKETEIEIGGRHDPLIAHRAAEAVNAATALAVCDMLAQSGMLF